MTSEETCAGHHVLESYYKNNTYLAKKYSTGAADKFSILNEINNCIKIMLSKLSHKLSP